MCHARGKKGHLAKVCRYLQPRTPKPVNAKGKPPIDKLRNHWIEEQEAEPFPDDGILKVQDHRTKPLQVTVELNGKSVVMEVDTGAAVSLMSETTQRNLFPNTELQQTAVKLHTYTAESLSVVGTMEVKVKYGNYVGKYKLFIRAPGFSGKE